jgi:GAF domain-containing protein
VLLARRASNERRRAAKAAQTAAGLEARRDGASARLRPLLSRLIELHRMLESRHLEAARLQEHFAAKLGSWGASGTTTTWPTFIDAVASAIGTQSAGVTLVGRDGAESLVATSDHVARLAHDVEFVTGEGPAHDVAATMVTIRADSSELKQRWPRYGPVVADHGVGSLLSVPLRQEPGGCLGALSVYDTAPAVTAQTAAISVRVADAFVHTVLNAPGVVSHDEIPAVPNFDEADFLATVHQAAGVVSVQHGCRTDDAVALLRARAFADGVPVETLAHQIIRGDLQL